MRWSCDRTGFPLLELPELGWSCGLWPVTKAQAEQWLAEPNGPGDDWYAELLAVHERVSWHKSDLTDYEGLLLTGLRPDEALAFAAWLGPEFGLPHRDTWRAAARHLLDIPITADQWVALAGDPHLHPAARWMLEILRQLVRPRTWGELALVRGGVLEWVRGGPPAASFGGLGEPRPRFHKLIFNPERDAPTRPPGEARSRIFGARLFCTLPLVPTAPGSPGEGTE
jgi:hypothetical protein